jgi:hypothetical protein
VAHRKLPLEINKQSTCIQISSTLACLGLKSFVVVVGLAVQISGIGKTTDGSTHSKSMAFGEQGAREKGNGILCWLMLELHQLVAQGP